MKKVALTVKLGFFRDDATGDYGVAIPECQDPDNGFNAFWDGQGIFHDVFEHPMEYKLPEFQGDYAKNVGGEMFAMGALMYYTCKLGIDRFPGSNNWRPAWDTAIGVTESLLHAACYSGYCNHGDRLLCAFGPQKDTHDYNFESMLDEYFARVERMRREARRRHKKETNKKGNNRYDETDYAKAYLRSLRFEKIRRLHRAGYHWASSLVPHEAPWDNHHVLSEFILWWGKFCKTHSAKELSTGAEALEFKIYHDDAGGRETRVSWICRIIWKQSYANDSGREPMILHPKMEPKSLDLKLYPEEVPN